MSARVKFISYDGAYPNLCRGTLVLEIDGEQVEIEPYSGALVTGGTCTFDSHWHEIVEEDAWIIDPEQLPDYLYQYADEIEDVVNENIPWGCCGGCL